MLQLVGCILYLVLVQGLATRRILYFGVFENSLSVGCVFWPS
jgi:hypothetical protein